MMRVTVQLPDGLYAEIVAAAGAQRRSVSAEVVWRLEQAGISVVDRGATYVPQSSWEDPLGRREVRTDFK